MNPQIQLIKLPRVRLSESITLAHLKYNVHLPTREGEKFLTEAVLKVDQGIKYLTQFWVDRPTDAQIARECERYGEFSARPYQIGQVTDASTFECVLALYHAYCQARSIDATQLLVDAYPGWESREKWTVDAWNSVLQCAEWHGVSYPEHWNNAAVLELLAILSNQNLLVLAEGVVQEILDWTTDDPS
jgi:hypothetical protein